MPSYRVEALEKFVVHTVYYVQAQNEQEAESLCRKGDVAYRCGPDIEEGDEEWLRTESIEQLD